MKVRIQLEDSAMRLVGATLRLDGLPFGQLTGQETVVDVERGWHILEVRDFLHSTRAMHFHVSPGKEIQAVIRPAHQEYLDYAWFDLIEQPVGVVA